MFHSTILFNSLSSSLSLFRLRRLISFPAPPYRHLCFYDLCCHIPALLAGEKSQKLGNLKMNCKVWPRRGCQITWVRMKNSVSIRTCFKVRTADLPCQHIPDVDSQLLTINASRLTRQQLYNTQVENFGEKGSLHFFNNFVTYLERNKSKCKVGILQEAFEGLLLNFSIVCTLYNQVGAGRLCRAFGYPHCKCV